MSLVLQFVAISLAAVILGAIVARRRSRSALAQHTQRTSTALRELRLEQRRRQGDALQRVRAEARSRRSEHREQHQELVSRLRARRVSALRRYHSVAAELEQARLRSEAQETRGDAFDLAKSQLKERRSTLEEREAAIEERLSAAAGTPVATVLEDWIRGTVERHRGAVERRCREREELDRAAHRELAREALERASNRYRGVSHLSRISNSLEVADEVFSALSDPSSSTYRNFVEFTGCELLAATNGNVLTVRGDDPLAREVARRSLKKLGEKLPAPANFQDTLQRIGDSVRREADIAGRKAVKLLGLKEVHADIVDLVGRLQFRLSYSQNQWKHSLEVGYLTGMLTAELGGRLVDGRRAGLMHDMGKALSHEREGSHAIIGAELAARCNESELVRNAIGAHHFDEDPASELAYAVIAADAVSGARPGARRASADNYGQRLRDIQRLASSADRAVWRVDVMQGGREVRVFVNGEEHGELEGHEKQNRNKTIPDREVEPLARSIAAALERELVYAGQIRVTVIRETRAAAVAR